MKSCDRKSGTEQPFTVDSQGFENDATPGSEFALAFVNLSDVETCMHCELVDLGLPVSSGFALDLRDAFTCENIGRKTDYFNPVVPGHDMKLYLCRLVPSCV